MILIIMIIITITTSFHISGMNSFAQASGSYRTL